MPELKFTKDNLLDRTIVLNGPSKTGKTIMTLHILETLRSEIDQVIVVAPSEPSNQSYTGTVNPLFIHHGLFLPGGEGKKEKKGEGGRRFLTSIWERQEMLAKLYAQANDLPTLKKLYDRTSPTPLASAVLADTDAARADALKKIAAAHGDTPLAQAQSDEINKKYSQMLAKVYKQAVLDNYAALYARRAEFSEPEMYCLTYLTINPRLLLILDDCAADIKPFFNDPIFRRYFYQNRHCFITMILCCQDDTDLAANLRKNAFITVYTNASVTRAACSRGAFAPNMIPEVERAAGQIFQGRGHRKLVYLREGEGADCQQIFYAEATPPKKFVFGSGALQDLCREVQAPSGGMDASNPFYGRFRINEAPDQAPTEPPLPAAESRLAKRELDARRADVDARRAASRAEADADARRADSRLDTRPAREAAGAKHAEPARSAKADTPWSLAKRAAATIPPDPRDVGKSYVSRLIGRSTGRR